MIKLNDEQRKLVEDNIALIHYVIKKHSLAAMYEYDDCFGVMAIGLCKAAATFDPSKGWAFTAYASKCMLNEMFMFNRGYKRRREQGISEISLETPVFDDNDTTSIGDTVAYDYDFTDSVTLSETIKAVFKRVEERYGTSRKKDYFPIFMLSASGMRHIDIASLYGVHQTVVSRKVKEVREVLRKELHKEGIEVGGKNKRGPRGCHR